jgi:hypothetical protein
VVFIGSDLEINGYRVSATVLTFAFLEEDSLAVPSLLEESTLGFFCRKTAAFLPEKTMISPLQFPYQLLGFSHWR